MTTFKTGTTNEQIIALAMRDELFAPESVSLESGGKSLTVRLPEKRKHFRIGTIIAIPCFTEDCDLDCDIESNKAII